MDTLDVNRLICCKLVLIMGLRVSLFMHNILRGQKYLRGSFKGFKLQCNVTISNTFGAIEKENVYCYMTSLILLSSSDENRNCVYRMVITCNTKICIFVFTVT